MHNFEFQYFLKNYRLYKNLINYLIRAYPSRLCICDENGFELFIYRHHIYYVNNLRTIRITRFAREMG